MKKYAVFFVRLLIKRCVIVFLSIFSLIPTIVFSQYSSTVHYTVKDGLPTSTIYCIVQDNQGFIWIATDAGLVRFDGSKFKVYTIVDGLPDNEILGLHFDQKANRIWILTYSKHACYYQNGIFFNSGNDPALKNIKCDFGEFINGNIQKDRGEFLFNAGSIYEYVGKDVKTTTIKEAPIFQVKKWNDSMMDVLTDSGVVGYKYGRIRTDYPHYHRSQEGKNGKWIDSMLIRFLGHKVEFYNKLANGDYFFKKELIFPDEDRLTGIVLSGDKFIISVWGKGLYTVDTGFHLPLNKIWTGSVNDFYEDKDHNLWIATIGEGIYLLRNQNVLNYSLDDGTEHNNITSMFYDTIGKKLYMGNTSGDIFLFERGVVKSLELYRKSKEKIRGITKFGRDLFFISNHEILNCDLESQKTTNFYHLSGGPKTILRLRDSKIVLVGLLSAMIKVNIENKSYTEKTLLKRVIALAQHPDGTVFFGSLDGLYMYKEDTIIHVQNRAPELQSRITSLCYSPDSILWIGTPSNGVIAYDGQKIIGHITTEKYLSYKGAICRKVISVKPNEVWIATNAGIDKIKYTVQDSLVVDGIIPFDTQDGLTSDDVNDMVIFDSIIYVGTSHGLSIIDQRKISKSLEAPIYISSVRINDKDSSIHNGDFQLSYWQNNLSIEFIGVLLSGGDVRYQYRLLGSGNDRWETTRNTSLEFRSLSPGRYTFEVAVLDKFGNRSNHKATLEFYISPAFYQTVWFWGIVIILILGVGFFIIRYTFQRRQTMNTKIIDLEQQALKAQMNPHFIFNCLTAIQHFVNKEDIYSANMYLSNFAKLIRKTLDLSGEQYITLDKEISYLENYIQLEKLRFQDKFKYVITVGEDIDLFGVQVPPMLLQPIIENAIRHGLRYKDGDEGELKINFSMDHNILICSIDDNGIGIKKSRELKSNMHVEYQSKGMKLTESRINAINMISEKKISMEVKDKFDTDGNAKGTIVIIYFVQ